MQLILNAFRPVHCHCNGLLLAYIVSGDDEIDLEVSRHANLIKIEIFCDVTLNPEDTFFLCILLLFHRDLPETRCEQW